MTATLINASNPSAWEVEAGEILVILRYKISLKSVLKLFLCPLLHKTRLNAVFQAAHLVNSKARRSALVMPLFVFPFPELCSV